MGYRQVVGVETRTVVGATGILHPDGVGSHRLRYHVGPCGRARAVGRCRSDAGTIHKELYSLPADAAASQTGQRRFQGYLVAVRAGLRRHRELGRSLDPSGGVRRRVVSVSQQLHRHVVDVRRQTRQVDRRKARGIHRRRVGSAAICQRELDRPRVLQRA